MPNISTDIVREIKTKKTQKCLSVQNLRIGKTHLVWRTIDSSVSDVRKGILKARILSGTYILRNTDNFCNRTMNAVRPHCQLQDEDLLHMITCVEMISKSQPAIKPLEAEIEKLSRECVLKIHMHNL